MSARSEDVNPPEDLSAPERCYYCGIELTADDGDTPACCQDCRRGTPGEELCDSCGGDIRDAYCEKCVGKLRQEIEELRKQSHAAIEWQSERADHAEQGWGKAAEFIAELLDGSAAAGCEYREDDGPRPYWRNARAMDAERDAEKLFKIADNLAAVVRMLGINERIRAGESDCGPAWDGGFLRRERDAAMAAWVDFQTGVLYCHCRPEHAASARLCLQELHQRGLTDRNEQDEQCECACHDRAPEPDEPEDRLPPGC